MDNQNRENFKNYSIESATDESAVKESETALEQCSATVSCEQEKQQPESSKVKRFFSVFTTVVLIVSTVVMAITVFLSVFVFFKVRVSGPSMQPTLNDGNILIVNKYGRIKYGSIIIIKDEKPNSSDWIIKRVIAVGGDTVEFVDGFVQVNGVLIDEPYLEEQGVTVGLQSAFVVPEDEIFYLGDNRTNSTDSRVFGTCRVEQVVGVVANWSMLFKDLFNK